MEFPRLVNSESSESEEIAESDRPICPSRKKKQRRRSYTDPSLFLEIFPEIEPDVLCKLSEQKKIKPSEVLALIPNASSAEIAELFTRLKGGAQKSPGPEHRYTSRSVPRDDRKPSLLEELKEDVEDAEDNRQYVKISENILKAIHVGCHLPPFILD